MYTRSLRRCLPLTALAAVALVSGCIAPGDEPTPEPPAERTGTVESPIASMMGRVEATIDAPWRMEPTGSDVNLMSNTYPKIPIVISVHDAGMQKDPEEVRRFGKFCGASVSEMWKDGLEHDNPLVPQGEPNRKWRLGTNIAPDSPNLREIERSAKWPDSSDGPAYHELCRHWKGEDCSNQLDASTSAEWHATIAYEPQQLVQSSMPASYFMPMRGGDDLELYVSASFAAPASRAGAAGAPS